MHLSLVIPAFNEEKRLPATLERVTRYLREQPYDWQVIVVDDGSEDATIPAAEACDGVSVMMHDQRLGRGAAVRTGMLGAYGQYRAWCDADGSVALEALDHAWPLLDAGADVVAGSRTHPEAATSRAGQAGRLLVDRVFQLRQRFWGLVDGPDALCPFQAWTAQACRRVFPLLRVDGHAGAAEALHVAQEHGLRLDRIPVRWHNHGQHRVHPAALLFRQNYDGLRIRLNSWRGRYR